MTLSSVIVVRVEKKPGGLSFGETMNGIRSWLDHRQIEPASFQSVANAISGVGFEIGFNSEDDAHVFEQEFHLARILEAETARLRRYARALTRDVSRADDLIQNCLTRAFDKQHLWQHGAKLRA
jgi:hypothetical protein